MGRTALKQTTECAEVSLRPVIKWVGGKGQLLGEIEKRLPRDLGNGIRKYAEPFVGGGAVLFYILSNYDLDDVYISDTNKELINVYRKIQTNVDDLTESLYGLQTEYWRSDEDDRKKMFYEMRKKFNGLIKSDESGDSVEAAVLFIFINRTCFNGLYRVNKRGLYNVPAGRYSNPLICDAENLKAVSKALRGVIIECADYRKSYDFIDNETFSYFDPPYRPLTKTAAFTSYTENQFGDDNQRELAEYAVKLKAKGAFVMLSNSDPKNTDPNDNFFDELYSQFDISRIQAARAINSNGDARGKISELLICGY
ncbi:MAG: DNA adenine methylase [Clostridia bacterium]|nr:DNA adenine methylase [Clostridia bacterium]